MALDLKKIGDLDRVSYDTTASLLEDFWTILRRLVSVIQRDHNTLVLGLLTPHNRRSRLFTREAHACQESLSGEY